MATAPFGNDPAKIWRHLPRFHGGTFDGMYQLWAPGPIIRMDALDPRGLYLLVVLKDQKEAERLRPLLGI